MDQPGFRDIAVVPLMPYVSQTDSFAENDLAGLRVGAGSLAFKVDSQGIWLGANEFADAPFRVDMQGHLRAVSADIGDYIPRTTDSTLQGNIQVGAGGKLFLDGVNVRMLVHDGTNNRVVVGQF